MEHLQRTNELKSIQRIVTLKEIQTIIQHVRLALVKRLRRPVILYTLEHPEGPYIHAIIDGMNKPLSVPASTLIFAKNFVGIEPTEIFQALIECS